METNASKTTETRQGLIDAKHEPYRRYTLVGKNEQEITRTAEQLLQGSELLIGRDLLIANLTAVFQRISAWCEQNSAVLEEALIELKRGKVSLYFVGAAERYDLELDRKMTDLEVQLGGSAGIGAVESFQIPPRSVDQFVGKDAVLIWQAPAH